MGAGCGATALWKHNNTKTRRVSTKVGTVRIYWAKYESYVERRNL